MSSTARSSHTLAVLVENRPGVLARVASMFSRRGYNIHSLAVGTTDDPRVSRLTIVVGAEAVQLEQITKQLNKLVHVLKIQELDPDDSVEVELQLVKVSAGPDERSRVFDLAEVFMAEVVDVDADSVTIEIAGNVGRLERFVGVMEEFGIREMVRSGSIALSRGGRSITDGSRLRLQRVV